MPTAVPIEDCSPPPTRGESRQRTWAISAAWSLAAAVAARGANLAAVVICARLLPQTGFGQLAAVLSTAGAFAPIAGLGLSMSTTKFLAQFRDTDRVRAGRMLTLSLASALLNGLAMTAGFRWAAGWISANVLSAPAMEPILLTGSGMILFGVLESVLTGALSGLGGFTRLAHAGAWSGALSLPLTAWMAWSYSTAGAVAGFTASMALSCLMHLYFLAEECRQQQISWQWRGALSEARLLIAFSLPSYVAALAMAPVAWLGNAMLVRTPGGFADLAIFSAAERYRSLLVFVPYAVSRTAVPELARLNAKGDAAGYAQAFRWNLTVAVAAVGVPAVLCALLAVPAMSVFGPGFRQGWPVLAVLAVSAIPTVLNTQLGAALLAGGQAWARAIADIILAAVFLLLGLWVIPQAGAIGLAVVYGVSYSIVCVVLAMFLRRRRHAA